MSKNLPNKKTICTFVLNSLSDDDLFRDLTNSLFSSEEKTIRIIINSLGGGIYEMYSLYDAIRYAVETRNINVQTIGIGAIMSSALLIFSAGKERYIGENSTIMWHWGSHSFKDVDMSALKNEAKEVERIEKLGNKLLIQRTNGKTSLKDLEKSLQSRVDWYITPTQAIDMGLADKYLSELPPI